MKRKLLKPKQILVPGEYSIGSNEMLHKYFEIFNEGHGKDLLPIIVARSDTITPESREAELQKRIRHIGGWYHMYGYQYYNKEDKDSKIEQVVLAYRRFDKIRKEASHYLLDGNHRAIAATLTNNFVHALELQCDQDVVDINTMVASGELPNFNRRERSLTELVLGFEGYILDHLDNFMTVKERVDKLVSRRELPEYMVKRYLKGLRCTSNYH